MRPGAGDHRDLHLHLDLERLLHPDLYLTNSDNYTVPVALRQFMDSGGDSSWGPLFAMSIISLGPIFGFFLAGQKYLVRGMATTGLK